VVVVDSTVVVVVVGSVEVGVALFALVDVPSPPHAPNANMSASATPRTAPRAFGVSATASEYHDLGTLQLWRERAADCQRFTYRNPRPPGAKYR
jgi:hypothetical protein